MDLNMMVREQARNGLQRELDEAVTNGDTEAARKASEKLAQLAVSTAPKAAPYGNDDIKTELEKVAWFGTDPVKSGRAMELGKHMDLKKFASAAAFAEALVKAVEAELKPTPAAGSEKDEDDEDEEEGETAEDIAAKERAAEARKRRTDGPGEGDNNQRANARRGTSSGPWTKLSDAPADIQTEVKRTADKFAPKTKEGREKYITTALGAHYAAHQRKTGKK